MRAENARWACPECKTQLALYDHAEERSWRHLDSCHPLRVCKMATIHVVRWNCESDGEMSEQAIRDKHQPSSSFRISLFRFPAGAKLNGSMRASVCYVLHGQCRYCFGRRSVILAVGDVAQLPEGTYTLETFGCDELEIALCWALPPGF